MGRLVLFVRGPKDMIHSKPLNDRILPMSRMDTSNIGDPGMSEREERSIWNLVGVVSNLSYTHTRWREPGPSGTRRRWCGSWLIVITPTLDAVLLERESAVFRGHRKNRSARRRPYYSRQKRVKVLHLVRLCGWSTKKTAARFCASQYRPELKEDPAK